VQANLWTLLIERQFNAATRMLFRTMISFSVPRPRMANAVFSVHFGVKMELLRATAPKQGSE
jgi:hypothetical protein